MDNQEIIENNDYESEKPDKTPDKAEGDEEIIDESIRIHEAKGDLKVVKPKVRRKKTMTGGQAA
jgi:hypothetical protein